jgi:hypothetical protein
VRGDKVNLTGTHQVNQPSGNVPLIPILIHNVQDEIGGFETSARRVPTQHLSTIADGRPTIFTVYFQENLKKVSSFIPRRYQYTCFDYRKEPILLLPWASSK